MLPLLEDPAPRERASAPARNAGTDGAVEDRVGHVAVEAAPSRERAPRRRAALRRGRSAQPKSPTSVSAKDDAVYCMRAVGARVAAVPGRAASPAPASSAPRRSTATSASRTTSSERRERRPRRRERERGERRGRRAGPGAAIAAARSSAGATSRGPEADERGSAPARTAIGARIVGARLVVRRAARAARGRPEEDDAEDLDEAGDGERADERERGRGEGAAAERRPAAVAGTLEEPEVDQQLARRSR